MFKQSIRRLATEVKQITPTTTSPFNISQPSSYTLAQLRSFPTLEPITFLPLPSSIFTPAHKHTRKDLLWSAVIYEQDSMRVGSNYAVQKAEAPYSKRKLRPQKGSGRARLGDANSPHMDNEIKAHVIKGYHDWSTELNQKQYNKACNESLSLKYKEGGLNIIDGKCDFEHDFAEISQSFIDSHKLKDLNLLFIVDETRSNLENSMKSWFTRDKNVETMFRKDKAKYLSKLKGKIINKDEVMVRDILRANRIFIEKQALQWMITKYGDI
ncbi:unnamed protein product [Candida verbasci]|uniref:Large ribosomal subunit protein uL4m n=1 Tax=Candida verbasci TaxID=1227364 RepID=A0A9W4U121_9ASCO|nr:unnamed protein product [Candida verbasci]